MRSAFAILSAGPSVSTNFFHIISEPRDFRRKVIERKIRVFDFSLQFVFKTFLILRRIQRDIIISVKTSLCKVPVIFVGL